MISTWVTPQFLAGVASILVGVIDAWVFHAAFGLQSDQALVVAGLSFLGGVVVPSPQQTK